MLPAAGEAGSQFLTQNRSDNACDSEHLRPLITRGTATLAHGYRKHFTEAPPKVGHRLPNPDGAGSDLGRAHAFQGLRGGGGGLPQKARITGNGSSVFLMSPSAG